MRPRLFAALLLCLAPGLHADGLGDLFNDGKPFVADPVAAEAALHRGEKLQLAKKWQEAIAEYQTALTADPDYVWANKALGTAYFLSGDKWQALTNYDKYLAANPGDTQTKTFADRLRADLGGGQASLMAVETPVPTPVSAPGIKVGWSVGGGLGLLLAGADDLNGPLAGTGANNFSGTIAYGLDLGADYDLPNGALGSVRVILGPNRSHSVDSGGNKVTVDISHFGLFAAPGFRFPLSPNEWIDTRLGLGYMTANMTTTASFSGTSVVKQAAGSGFGFWPEVGYARMIQGQWGGRASLGYLLSSVGPMGSSTLNLTTGGLSARVGVDYYL